MMNSRASSLFARLPTDDMIAAELNWPGLTFHMQYLGHDAF